MDSSTKANLILGEANFNINELGAKDRLRIIEKILFWYGSYLKYLTNAFKPIDSFLNWEREGSSRITREDSISSDSKIDLHIPYMSFGNIGSDPEEEEKKEEPSGPIKTTFGKGKILLLSRKENWVIWSYDSKITTEGQGLVSWETSEIIERCDFKVLEREEFLEILGANDLLLYVILEFLGSAVRKDARKKMERAKNIEAAALGIRRIHSRIKF